MASWRIAIFLLLSELATTTAVGTLQSSVRRHGDLGSPPVSNQSSTGDVAREEGMLLMIQDEHVRHAALFVTDYPIANVSNNFTISSSKLSSIQIASFACVLVLAFAYGGYKTMSGSAAGDLVSKLFLAAFYIGLSAAMIESNKWLMAKDRYPYPFTLTCGHMLMSGVLANILRLVCPSLFPAFQNLTVTPKYCAKFLPIGIFFALSLVAGNAAYKYLSVSFLQLMKQANVCIVYTFSAIVGLEAIRRCSSIILLGVIAGACLGVKGELHFVLLGFVLQLGSSLCEASKVIMQSLIMSGESRLDPLTMVLFMAPACFLVNLIPQILMEGPISGEIVNSFLQFWPVILGNAAMAFTLNVTVAQCIKNLSAVGYLLAGIVKDICIIVTSTWLLGESLTPTQVFGFSMSLLFVSLYSIYKRNPDCFEDDHLVLGFARVFGFEQSYAKMAAFSGANGKGLEQLNIKAAKSDAS